MRIFLKIKFGQKGEITLPFTDMSKSCPNCIFFYIANMSFNAICENKILAKISEFTVNYSHTFFPSFSGVQHTLYCSHLVLWFPTQMMSAARLQSVTRTQSHTRFQYPFQCSQLLYQVMALCSHPATLTSVADTPGQFI